MIVCSNYLDGNLGTHCGILFKFGQVVLSTVPILFTGLILDGLHFVVGDTLIGKIVISVLDCVFC